jgi:1,4-dihydroxy-2-naphthoyl-CoA hydrolase
MRIWKQPISVELLTAGNVNSAASHLGIEFLEVGDDFIRARVLAETLGSCGAAYAAPAGQRTVGLDINANHLKGTCSGWVTGITRPVHIGRSTQVWQIELRNDAGELTCVSRITMAMLSPKLGSNMPLAHTVRAQYAILLIAFSRHSCAADLQHCGIQSDVRCICQNDLP